MKFKEYKGLDLPGLAADVLKEWDAQDTFHKSISTREGHPTFVFYEGPPSANGTPGIHHVMARTIKDIFCRYKTQQGYLVHRKAGWDTHGLPVELGVEKETRHHQGGHRAHNLHRGVQPRLPRGGDGVHGPVGRTHAQNGLLGQYGRPLHHLRQQIHRNPLVASETGSSTRGYSTKVTPSSPTRRPPARDFRPTS